MSLAPQNLFVSRQTAYKQKKVNIGSSTPHGGPPSIKTNAINFVWDEYKISGLDIIKYQ